MNRIRRLRILLPMAVCALTMCLRLDSACGYTALLVTKTSTLATDETFLRTQMQSWGYTVNTIVDSDSQANFNAAVALADVVYVPYTVDATDIAYKLRTVTIGIVSESPGLDQEFGIGSGDGYTQSWHSIYDVTANHPITTDVPAGAVVIYGNKRVVVNNNTTIAAGLTVLSTQDFGKLGMGSIEAGGALANTYSGNSTASGRRVRLPWGQPSLLNSNGLLILRNALAWAASSLEGHWKLVETSGTTATDSSAYGHNGTYTGGVILNQVGPYPGVGAIAADFDGVNDRVDATVMNISTGQKSVSITAWVYLDTYVDNAAVLENGSASNFFSMTFNSSGQFRLQWATDSVTSSTPVPLGTWTHLAATYDGTTVRLFQNGQLVATQNKTISWTDFTGALAIGYSPIGTSEYLDGKLFDVRLYNTALTDEEVTDLYGLVGHWKLDETSGTSAADSTLNLNDGTYTGGVTLNAAGPYSGSGAVAAQFDGNDDYVSIPDDATLKPTSALSITGWVRGNNWNTGSFVNIILRKGEGNPNNYQLAIADGQVALYLDENDNQGTRSSTTLNTDQWYHVAATWDGTQVKIYVDGTLETTQSRTGTISTDTRLVYLGGRNGTDLFDGRLDDVRLYNRALSPEEITAMQAPPVTGLVAHWTFDEGTGSTIADSSGNGNDATFNAGSPNWNSKCSGDVFLEFDGSNDADTNTDFDPPGTGSVAFWYRDDPPYSPVERLLGLGSDWEVRMISGRFRFDISIVDGFDGPTAIANDGLWHHVVVLYNSTADTYSLYIDGEFVSSGSLSLDDIGAAKLYFGASSTNFSERFSGALNDVRVYDYELSISEIAALSGVVGRWRLDETGGTTALDSSVNANHGTYVGNPTLSANGAYPPATDTAVELNGNDEYVDTGQSLLNNRTEFTIAGWVRPDQVANQTSFFGQNDVIEVGLKYGTNQVHFWTAAAGQINVTGELPIGQWTHIAAVGNGVDLKLYINGVEAATGGSSTTNYGTSGYNFKIGEGVYDPSGDYFDGRVDDVRLLDRALCPEDINAIYKGGRPGGVRIIEWLETR